MNDEDSRLPKSTCPYCGYEMDAATHATSGEATPHPDDIGICLECGGAMVYQEDMRLRVLTSTEVAAMSQGELAALELISTVVRGKR